MTATIIENDLICLVVALVTFVLVRKWNSVTSFRFLGRASKNVTVLGLFLFLMIQSVVFLLFARGLLTIQTKVSSNRTMRVPFNQTLYNLELNETTAPFANVTTAAFFPLSFYSGYRNQGMVFNMFVLKCMELNHSQIVLSSIKWKDQFGTDQRLRHDRLFDVVYWNSFYPRLPRFVQYDPVIHVDLENFHGEIFRWRHDDPMTNATRPYALVLKQHQMFVQYRKYNKRLLQNPSIQRHPTDTLILQGAFRPHPGLEEIMNIFVETSLQGASFLALHARVEPDMQKHPVCRDAKVLELQRIIDMLYQTWKEPPVSQVLIMLGRDLLEQEPTENQVAVDNLRVLNDIIQHGLWNGTVGVVEAGSHLLDNTTFGEFAPSIGGSIVNYFLSLEAEIFVGTEVSSFSNNIQTTRFVRGNLRNYKYLPNGLVQTTPEGTHAPPPFVC